jgi:hypothetical protein
LSEPRHGAEYPREDADMKTHLAVQYFLSFVVVSLASCGGGSGGSSLPAAPTNLSYSQAPTFVVGVAISPLTPTVKGTVTSYAVSPALPGGLSLNTSTGAITGTPTAVTALANYTVTASNQGGNTSTAVAIAVNAVAPSISYGGTSFTLTTAAPAQGLTPTNTGGAVVTWSISPALPAGLTFSTSTGAISGTPTAVSAPVTYVVTAQNSGGQGTARLTLGVQSVLLDLGHIQAIVLLRLTSSRVLSMDSLDTRQYWVLWDYATAAKITGALSTCVSSACVAGKLPPVDLEGATLVDEAAAGLEVRSASDGSVHAVIGTPVAWWKLAADGSYVCTGSASALTVWSLTGAVITSRTGDYSKAAAFAAPGQVQVALGPAGASVVETVALPSGSSSVTPAFQGTFNSWFQDGQHFLTNTGNTVWTYTNAGVQADITALPTVENLTGQGNWFWTYSASVLPAQVAIYKVGASGSPAATISFPYLPAGGVASPTFFPSGARLGILDQTSGAGKVVDLSGSNVTTTDFTAPIGSMSVYAAVSGSQWLIGNAWGVLLDGASIAGTPRYFGYGAAWSIAGSSTLVAVATASGAIVYFDAATNVQKGTINFPSSQIALSSDGTVLAAAGDQSGSRYPVDPSLRIYSLPSGTQTYTWPYSTASQPYILPYDITLSDSGTALGQVLTNCSRQVTAVTGGPVLWSDTLSPSRCSNLYLPIRLYPDTTPIRLSPDGTKVAVSNELSDQSATNIYSNGTLVTAVPGWVVGWLDGTHILVNSYIFNHQVAGYTYSSCAIYDSSGTKLAAPPLPELKSLQIVSADSVYDQSSNAVYSITTGLPTWTSASPSTGVGAVAGSNIVFASGNEVLFEPY